MENTAQKRPEGSKRIVYTKGKHRYLMPLDKETKKNILNLSKPYPKRTKEQESENPSGLGGASPTCTLQSSALL